MVVAVAVTVAGSVVGGVGRRALRVVRGGRSGLALGHDPVRLHLTLPLRHDLVLAGRYPVLLPGENQSVGRRLRTVDPATSTVAFPAL